jgi:signal transduction histidine kinase
MTAPVWRAVVAFRVAALAYAIGLVLYVHLDHPLAAAGALILMAAWTAVMTVANGREQSRSWNWCLVDLAVATAMLLATAWVDPEASLISRGFALTGPWPAASVLSCAILGGPWRGLLASLPVVAATIVIPGEWRDADTIDNLVLLLLAAGGVGLAVSLLEQAEHQLRLLVERDAATAERDRLARSIHDGVLQVLALIQREGPQLGDRGADLARLAGEQEIALRGLMTRDRSPTGTELKDLRDLLASAPAELAMPATPILLPATVADELAAAINAALHNVARHAGPQAKAWILVEAEPNELIITVRDDGAGIDEGRLAAAAAEGRLGVAQSIHGRVSDLGGHATITSRPGHGTEVELRLPRLQPAGARNGS